jgi:hypothetical protein
MQTAGDETLLNRCLNMTIVVITFYAYNLNLILTCSTSEYICIEMLSVFVLVVDLVGVIF